MRVILEANQAEQLRHARADSATRCPGDLEREGDVLVDRLLRQQPEILEDDPDPAAQRGHLAATQAAKVAARDDDAAGRGHLLADQQTDERALAGARLPHQEDEITLGDLHADVAQRGLAVRVGHPHVGERDDRWSGAFCRVPAVRTTTATRGSRQRAEDRGRHQRR